MTYCLSFLKSALDNLIKNKEIDLIYINLPDYLHYKYILNSIQNNRRKIESILISLKIKDSNIEIIDKSIMYFAINEMITGDLDKLVVIDESLRLSKKFSSPESYKFINACLDKFSKLN